MVSMFLAAWYVFVEAELMLEISNHVFFVIRAFLL